MKTYLFVAEDGETAQTFNREAVERGLVVQQHTGDESESIRLRQLYDVTTRPAVLVTLEDGSYVQMWQGRLPTIAELNHAVQGH